jgi:hypothetical protein
MKLAQPLFSLTALALPSVWLSPEVREVSCKDLDKKYIYFAMAFSLAVEMLNLRVRSAKSRPSQAFRDVPPSRHDS